MFYTTTLVVMLFLVWDAACGKELSEEKVTDETLAEQWFQEMNGNMEKIFYEAEQATWNFYTNSSVDKGPLLDKAYKRRSQFEKEACKNASSFDWKIFIDTSLTRRFDKLLSECSPLMDNETAVLKELSINITAISASAEICKGAFGNETCYSLGTDPTELVKTSRNWTELLWSWAGYRNVSGKKMKLSYTKMVSLLNKEANLRGCRDFGECWRSVYEMDDFSSACENLWEQIKPLYQQLHAYVRRKLMDSYPKNRRDFPNTNHIPAHILGNMWALRWYHINDLVKPFPNRSIINVTNLLNDQGYEHLRMFREADTFFTSLGLPEMPQEFWNHLIIEQPTDEGEVICTSATFDFYNKRDFGIYQCSDVSDKLFIETHRHMALIQYYMNYKDQPVIYHDGANPAFQEAVSDVIALYAITPQHLRNINLLHDKTDDHESEMNFLMRLALEEVPIFPYGYLIDKWRYEVADGTITPENYNKKYWKLRCGIQGVSPPVNRSEKDFDPGAKLEVDVNWPLIRVSLSPIIMFQFHKSLCEAAGHVGPLHKCDIYSSKAAGDKLRKMMLLGASKPWQDAMEIMTGQRNMDAGPLLEYFRPLQDWLEMENKGKDVGWDENCPVGSIQ